MQALFLRISLAASLLTLVSLVGVLPAWSDSGRGAVREPRTERPRDGRSQRESKPLSYRSPGATHKLMLSAQDADLERRLTAAGVVRRLKKYRSYSIAEVGDSELQQLDASTLERAPLRDDLNLVKLKRGQLDTTGPEPSIAADLRQKETTGRALRLVQLFGPPTPDSLRTLTATGAKVVGYVPNNTYLMWATRAERQKLRALRQGGADGSNVVQWEGAYHPAYKLDPHIKLDSVEQISTSVVVLDTPDADNTVALAKGLADKVLVAEFRAAGTVHLKILAQSNRLKELAQAADVLAIEPWSPMKLMDERADQIVAGAISTQNVNNIQVSGPSGPGYLAFLNSVGLNSDFDFAVDIGDTGFDTGSADAAKIHPDFLNASGASRVAYLHDFTGDSHPDPTILPTHDQLGHGTINASIVGGFNNKSGAAFADAQGFQYGLGIAPFVRIGASKLFADVRNAANFTYVDYISAAYASGARISNNSWGSDCGAGTCNLYSDDSLVFDSLVRDANPFSSGNQSMTIVFAAGNDGDLNEPTVAIPGTAKNVITVGLSENVRGTETDGCGVRGRDADNAQDIVFFSGFGPSQDGRAKPDLVAPGSHIQGAASQDKLYTGDGVCDKYFPIGQTLYTWSSGTSHSTPMVAGAAALAFQWLKNRLGAEPSPALIKALILNSTSYLTGAFAGDNLPGTHQGWGLLDIGRMFESTDRSIFEESPDRTFTESGGAPFETTGVITDPTKEFRAMLVWSDAPGNSVTNAPYVNQLNLEVVVDGVVYTANHFSGQYSTPGGQKDFANNVQAVRLPAGTTGPYVIRIRPTIIAGDGVPGNGNSLDQDFALVVTNAHEMAIPVLAVESLGDVSAGVTVQHSSGPSDASLIPGESAKITVTVRNQSQTTGAMIQNAALSLSSSSSDSTYQAIAASQTGNNATPFQIQVPSGLRCGSVATLQLQLDTDAGRFTLPVRVQVGRPSQPGAPVTTILFEDVDNARVKWKKKGGFEAFQGPAKSGNMSFHTEDPGKSDNDNRLSLLFTKKQFTIPSNAGQIRLSFFHIFNFEPGYDGGILEISSDGGDTWQDAGSRILVGGYDGKLTEFSNNPLGNAFAWTARGVPGVFSQVVVDLSDYAGQQIRLRFSAGFDNATGVNDGYTGWFIDDIQITAVLYSCGQQQAESAESQASAGDRRPTPGKTGAGRVSIE